MPNGIFDSNVTATPAASATGSNGADGIDATSDSGIGVQGQSTNGTGVWAQSTHGIGLHAVGGGTTPTTPPASSLVSQVAILADGGTDAGVFAICSSGTGVASTSSTGTGIVGRSDTSNGVVGGSGNLEHDPPLGSSEAAGVYGESLAFDGNGVIGKADNGTAAYGVWGRSDSGFAGFFSGNVSIGLSFDGTKQGDLHVGGTLTKGMGGFRIDHPLDPENKYLSHSFVESPDMLNVYNGNVTTDANGDAAVMLPDYFEALNQDFRYQLTVIGQFAQAMVAGEIRNNQFTIKTDKPDVKVSWQVTGIRKDPVATTHRLVVEEDKPAEERGTYLHPQAHGKSETQSLEYARGKRLKGP